MAAKASIRSGLVSLWLMFGWVELALNVDQLTGIPFRGVLVAFIMLGVATALLVWDPSPSRRGRIGEEYCQLVLAVYGQRSTQAAPATTGLLRRLAQRITSLGQRPAEPPQNVQ